ncbi:hypothetical protein PV328_007461 [Microctonus aethiopoides]|uniref:Uncharacterized protein n=1 Tax=Microctonus aethiopoides TaxID=144406 RepID=A0AA39C8X3_9HYME|nr:hypothetical protein PV328_007461 [Microctonus aethiopoides]
MEKVQILIGIIGIIIGTNIIPSFAAWKYSNSTMENIPDGSIIRYLNYTDYQTISASLSQTKNYFQSSFYFIFDFKNYANSFSEFEKKYPLFIMTTSGKAVSNSTFGDVGKNHFGPLTLSTNEFVNKKRPSGYVVLNEFADKWSTYHVNARMGIYFFIEHHSTKLRATPYLSGTLTSHGLYTRSLDFGWTIETIVFIPKN